MAHKNLAEALRASKNVVTMLRNSHIGAYVYPVVAPEFTNWRDEQRGWRETCALYDLSHHMVNLFIRGPDAVRLVSILGFNSFKNFTVGMAKQFVPCNYEGYVIGDGILFYLAEGELVFVGRNPAANWIRFHAETGNLDLAVEYDDRSPSRPMGKPIFRKLYRYQIQGPQAGMLIRKLNDGIAADIKFFSMGFINIAGRKVRALGHGMAGAPGLEIWGPFAEAEEIRSAILAAGKEFDLVQVGSRAYATCVLESGWIPGPVPAIYTGDKLKAYREWLPGTSYEAIASLGGSFVSPNIADYYVSPHELGYGSFIKFDHDFIGKEALQNMQGRAHRKKVTFVWNDDDVMRILRSMFEPPGRNYKFLDFPLTNYASSSFDTVISEGRVVGASMFSGYTFNERKMLSVGIVEPQCAEPGTQLTLIWGEENGGTNKTTVERHQGGLAIRVTVGPTPYSTTAREAYHEGWRTASRSQSTQ